MHIKELMSFIRVGRNKRDQQTGPGQALPKDDGFDADRLDAAKQKRQRKAERRVNNH